MSKGHAIAYAIIATQVVVIALRLDALITWSWLAVLSPLWAVFWLMATSTLFTNAKQTPHVQTKHPR